MAQYRHVFRAVKNAQRIVKNTARMIYAARKMSRKRRDVYVVISFFGLISYLT
jgi:hypothetical protein